jgi:uncharacterized protein
VPRPDEEQGESLQLYLSHDLHVPIGSIESVGEDKKGLRYEAHLPKDDTLVAGRVVPQIKRRSLKANSFGYKVQRSERRKSDGVRLLHEIDIYEISVVGMPANPAAVIESVSKNFKPDELETYGAFLRGFAEELQELNRRIKSGR